MIKKLKPILYLVLLAFLIGVLGGILKIIGFPMMSILLFILVVPILIIAFLFLSVEIIKFLINK